MIITYRQIKSYSKNFKGVKGLDFFRILILNQKMDFFDFFINNKKFYKRYILRNVPEDI